MVKAQNSAEVFTSVEKLAEIFHRPLAKKPTEYFSRSCRGGKSHSIHICLPTQHEFNIYVVLESFEINPRIVFVASACSNFARMPFVADEASSQLSEVDSRRC